MSEMTYIYRCGVVTKITIGVKYLECCCGRGEDQAYLSVMTPHAVLVTGGFMWVSPNNTDVRSKGRSRHWPISEAGSFDYGENESASLQ